MKVLCNRGKAKAKQYWINITFFLSDTLVYIYIYVCVTCSSTAKGSGGSFKNTKPMAGIGCCESLTVERAHWWTERWIECRTIHLSICLFIDLSINLSFFSAYWSICLSIYRSLCLSIHLPSSLSVYAAIHSSSYCCLRFVSICLSFFLFLSVEICPFPCLSVCLLSCSLCISSSYPFYPFKQGNISSIHPSI